jgi:hypothetical protein
MHFSFVPVVEDNKRNGLKVCAKECITKQELKVFHPELEKHLENVFGYEVGILNDATKEGNKSIEELKKGAAAIELSNLRFELEYTKQLLETS